jgi:hypothetical protein
MFYLSSFPVWGQFAIHPVNLKKDEESGVLHWEKDLTQPRTGK